MKLSFTTQYFKITQIDLHQVVCISNLEILRGCDFEEMNTTFAKIVPDLFLIQNLKKHYICLSYENLLITA